MKYLPIEKLNWIGTRINWEVSDEDIDGVRTPRVIELRRSKRWFGGLEPVTRAEVQHFIDTWGFEVSQEIYLPGIGSFVLVVRYHDGPAHTVTGPYRIVE